MSFHAKCKACGKIFHGWANVNICSICGGNLEEIEEVNCARKEGKKILKKSRNLLIILRAIFWPSSR